MTVLRGPTCGAETRTCHCSHHQREHAVAPPEGTHRGPCEAPGCDCPGFHGRPCTIAKALFPNGRCQRHGGPSLTGMAHPKYKDGRSAKVSTIPKRMAAEYERVLADPQLLSLSAEIARCKVYYQDLEQRMEDGGVVAKATLDAVAKVEDAFAHFEASRTTNDQARIKMALAALTSALRKLFLAASPAAIEVAVREELRTYWKDAATLTDKQGKQIERIHGVVTHDKVMALVTAQYHGMEEAINRHVADPSIRRAIQKDVAERLRQLDRGPDGPPVDPGGRAEGFSALPPETED